MEVSIIIVNYNTRDILNQCLGSIYQYTADINFEIILVDNASADGSTEMIKARYPEVILIESKENLGFGRANNLGAKHASGTYLFLLNSDTIMLENSIKILYNFFESTNDPNLAVIGCKLLDINKRPHISYGNFPSIRQELFEYGLSRIFRKYYLTKLSPSVCDASRQIKEVDYIMGADLFFKKQIFEQVNGFDEDFFLYYEETEICFRLKKKGYRILWVPLTSIIHYIGASGNQTKEFNYWILEQLHKSKYLYYKKCYGILAAILIKYINMPKILIIHRKQDMLRIFKILMKVGSEN